MATSSKMVVRPSVCQLHVCEFALTSDGVFIKNRSDDTQEAQIAQQGPFNTNLR